MKQTESSDPQVAHGAEHFPVRLADALRDLGEAKDEARDEGFRHRQMWLARTQIGC